MGGHSLLARPGALARPASCALLAVAALTLPSFVSAEVAQRDGVRVKVSGSMAPTELPRKGSAPIAVSLAGKIAATKAGELPQLERISIAINRHGRVDLRGIPRCRLGHINPSTTAQAMAACRPALIGEGQFSADVRIPDQSPFPSQGKVLAFNGKLRGKPAIFAHIYGTRPIPTSYVLPFSIRNTSGTFGTVLEASLPNVTGEWGYVTGISLELRRGYLQAGCPAPKGFPGAVFPLVRTGFSFAGGTNLSLALQRNCKVR